MFVEYPNGDYFNTSHVNVNLEYFEQLMDDQE